MKTILAATAALGLAFTAAPAMAGNHMEGHMDGNDIMLNAEQQAMMNDWPQDRKMTYMAWPADAQAYYWTLDTQKQTGWWMLNDTQRVQLVGMNAQDQAVAWRTIGQQVGNTAARSSTMPAAMNNNMNNNMNSDVRFVSEPMIQRIAAPMAGEYPLCNNGRTDNCMNPWEAGKRGAGVTKPLDYWPGKPASEM